MISCQTFLVVQFMYEHFTAQLKDMYPALFCRSAIVQEFTLMEERKCMQMAEEKALLKTPRFIQLARKQLQLLD